MPGPVNISGLSVFTDPVRAPGTGENGDQTTFDRSVQDLANRDQFLADAIAAISTPTVAFSGGDLGGSSPNPTVVGLQARPVANTAPTTGQILGWNGSAWAPVAVGAPSLVNDVLTGSAGTITLLTIPLDDNSVSRVIIVVTLRDTGVTFDDVRSSMVFSRSGGAATQLPLTTDSGPSPALNIAGVSVSMAASGNNAVVSLTTAAVHVRAHIDAYVSTTFMPAAT